MMIGSFFKTSLRRLRREKYYVLINVSGLAFAIACVLVLFLYLRIELTYDQHFDGHDRIFRVVNRFTINGQDTGYALSSAALGPLLAREYSELSSYVRFRRGGRMAIRYDTQTDYWDRTYYTDPDVFEIFSHRIIHGNPATALADPQSIAVSESFARHYFGEANPLGEVVTHVNGDDRPMVIRLVFTDLPENTHLQYDVLLAPNNPVGATPESAGALQDMLFNLGAYTYLRMPQNFRADDFNVFAADLKRRFVEEDKTFSADFWLQPLADIHYNSDLTVDLPQGNRMYLYSMALITLFIMLVACINYTNLATARSASYGKEVGLSKVFGASRSGLILKFLLEAALLVVIALAVALLMLEVLLNFAFVENLLGKQLTLNVLEEPDLLLWLLSLAATNVLLAGIYPAIFLSSLAPLSALMSSGKKGNSGHSGIRKLLVPIQLTVSIVVVATTVLMFKQLELVANTELGFEKHDRLVIRLNGLDLIEQSEVIRNELLQHSDIKQVSVHTNALGGFWPFTSGNVENENGVPENTRFIETTIDSDYLDAMEIELASGRNFSKQFSSDNESSVLVNEAMVRQMGWEQPIGKQIREQAVVGVVSDFHFTSLYNPIEPLVIKSLSNEFEDIKPAQRPFIGRYMTIRLAEGDHAEAINVIENLFAEFNPGLPFEYELLDATLDDLYQSERNLMTLTGILAAICIVISCLGLFGLTAFITAQRAKEIAVRKVIGATSLSIVMLFIRSLLFTAMASVVVSSLFVYYLAENWLAEFAYRIDLTPYPVLLGTLITMIVAITTVAFQTQRAAQRPPVEGLRYE